MRIYFGIFLFFGFVFSFFVRASKMSYFTAFSCEIAAFYTSSSTSPASFSTSPACPTNIPSITNKLWVTKSKNVAGGLTGQKNNASNRRAFQSQQKNKQTTKQKKKNTEQGGWGGRQPPPIMVAVVMIRIGVQLNPCKKSKK